MSRIVCAVLLGSLAASFFGCVSLSAEWNTEESDATFADTVQSLLSPLEGRWSGPLWGGTFVATYGPASAFGMLSHSELTTDGEVGFYEFERFHPVDGILHMQPYPMGQPEMVFALAEYAMKPGNLVFENTNNDFPTRISYDTTEVGVLTILLTDPHSGSNQVETIRLERVAQP